MIKFIPFLLLFSHICLGQAFNFKQYSVDQGLAQSQVLDVCQDRFGSLWFATLGGLSKFDGIEFQNYDKRHGLISSQIYKVLADRNGYIWTASMEGLSRYNGQEFFNISFQDYGIDAIPIAFIEDSKGRIWVGLTNGVCVWEDDSLKYYNKANGYGNISTNTIIEDTNGDIWLSSYASGIFRFRNSVFVKEKHLIFPPETEVNTMYFDKNQKLLVGTNHGIWEIKEDQAIKIFNLAENISVHNMTEDKEGDLWITTNAGAGKIENGTFSPFDGKHGLTDAWLYKIFKDREGTLWFASDGEGVFNFPPAVFTHFDKSSGLNQDVVYDINKDGNGTYWFGTFNNGLNSYNGEEIKSYTAESGAISNDFIRCSVVDKNGAIWVGTENGLNKFDGSKFKVFTSEDGLPSSSIRAAFKDKKGVLWFGTTKGLTKYDGRNFTNFLPENWERCMIRCIYELPDNKLLLSTPEGLLVFDGKNFSEFNIPGLERLFPLTIIDDKKDNIFFGVPNEGIFRYNLNTRKVRKFDVKDGLSSYIIFSLIFDDQGDLWAGTERGIDRITFDKQGEIRKIKNFSKEEGFLGIETNGNAVFKNDDSSLWFGSIDGVYKYNKTEDIKNPHQPLTYIHNVQLFLEDTDWQQYADSVGNWFGIPHQLRLSHQNNHLTFHYLGNSLINPNRVKYQYLLENFDKNWSPITSQRQAVYANVPPGLYTFKVKAANSDGVWVESPATFTFEIAPPFWQRWWFFIAIIALLLIGITTFYKYKINTHRKKIELIEKVKNEEKELVRKSMAKDFHDEMGNQLASITVFASLIQLKLNGTSNEIKDIASNIEKSSKRLYSGTKDFIWSMDAKNESTHEVFTYLRDFGEEFFRNSSIRFYAELIDRENSSTNLTLGSSRQLILIFKEGMTNALKHSQAQQVWFRVENLKNGFRMTLSDDGIGLPEANYEKRGITNIVERARNIGYVLRVKSKSKGTLLYVEGSYARKQKKPVKEASETPII